MDGLTAKETQKVLKLVLENQCEKFDQAMKEAEYAIMWWHRFCAGKDHAQRAHGTFATDKRQWEF